jgi:hypothetical protein
VKVDAVVTLLTKRIATVVPQPPAEKARNKVAQTSTVAPKMTLFAVF